MIKINGTPVHTTIFPDNTSQVWKLPEEVLSDSLVSVEWEYSHEGEVMQLAQLKTLLDSRGVQATLLVKYLPYARQDKEVSNTSTFALLTFARILNPLKFLKIVIMDPHSPQATHALQNAIATYPTERVEKIFKECEIDLLCYPDAGAHAKYSKIYDHPFVYGEKVREQETGRILSYALFGDVKGKNVMIVDDICDGGATFKLLAKDLLATGAKSVVLFVTHGIFSKGTRTLFESGIERVFTQDGEVGPRSGSKQF